MTQRGRSDSYRYAVWMFGGGITIGSIGVGIAAATQPGPLGAQLLGVGSTLLGLLIGGYVGYRRIIR